uniref:Uncharacterized protein n=1 Tax=Rhizophora mucronata TaxID=61149 RepID=A0A2P2Q3L5_RHIMU
MLGFRLVIYLTTYQVWLQLA